MAEEEGENGSQLMEFARKPECELLFAKLALLKVAEVSVEFNGSGDSGSIDGVSAVDAQGKSVDLTEYFIDWTANKDVFMKDGWKRSAAIESMSLDTVLTSICDEALDQSNLDWYNNDGGFGTLHINLCSNPPTAKLDMHLRITVTDDHTFELTGLYKE